MVEQKMPKSAPEVQKFIEVKEIKDGVVIMKDNSLKNICICSSINFDLLSTDEQEAIIARFQEFLNALDFSLQILISSRHFEIGTYLDQIRELEKKQSNELLRVQTSEYINFVESFVEFANIMNKAFYVIIPFRLVETKEESLTAKFKNIVRARKTKKEEFKPEKFNHYKNQLEQRTNLIIQELQGLGIKAVPLNDEQLTELFYEFYNVEN
jgi:type IV secretory pathway VirB4 component